MPAKHRSHENTEACVALVAAAMRGRCSFFETLRGSSPAAPDPAAPGGAGRACNGTDVQSAHQWPCGDLAFNLAAEPPRGLPAACTERGSPRSSEAWLEAHGGSAGRAGRVAGVAEGPAGGAPATWGSGHARKGGAAARAAQAAGAPAAPSTARYAPAAGATGALRHPCAALPRQRSADLCLPAEEEAFLRSLGWQECDDEAAGAPSRATHTAAPLAAYEGHGKKCLSA